MDLTKMRVAAVLNTASGSCTAESAQEMKEILQAKGIEAVHMWCGDSSELEREFSEADSYHPDVLIVLGGDGTIRSAAERARSTGAHLIPLPGGTMNVLPKALYGTGNWKEVLERTIERPMTKAVSGGEVQGTRFFISAICGAPTLWTHAREALRDGEIKEAIKHGSVALDRMFKEKIQYHFNEMHEGAAEALMVTCPLVSSALDDDRKVFEAAVIEVKHAGDVLGLATTAAFGQWRDSGNVALVRTDRVKVSSDGNVPIIVDGEAIDIGSEAEILFVPHAFNALVPSQHEVLS
jgi:diacylglycerol kinase family enzyme